MKTAIVILSDPKSGSEESLGRLFNGLAAAYDFKQKGDEVSILFQGTGVRWAKQLNNSDHPAHQLYKSIEPHVAGASHACTEFFSTPKEVIKNGLELIKDNEVPGTAGLPSLQKLIADGYQLLIF